MGFWSNLMMSLFGGAAAAGDYYERLLALSPGETIASSAVGKHVNMVGNHVTIGAQYILAITNMGRLVLGDMQTLNPGLARHFNRGTVRVEDRGYLDEDGGIITDRGRYTQAGPTGAMEFVKILAFVPAQGAPFTVFMVESAVPQFVYFCTG